MAVGAVDRVVADIIAAYLDRLSKSGVPVWRVYLFGSHAKGSATADSDIDLAVFYDRDDIEGFKEDVELMALRRDIDLRIEPHAFARTDLDDPDPFVQEIVENGLRLV